MTVGGYPLKMLSIAREIKSYSKEGLGGTEYVY
jgi:hypothetical protein